MFKRMARAADTLVGASQVCQMRAVRLATDSGLTCDCWSSDWIWSRPVGRSVVGVCPPVRHNLVISDLD